MISCLVLGFLLSMVAMLVVVAMLLSKRLVFLWG